MTTGRSRFGLVQVAVLLLVLSVLMLVGFLRGFVAAEPAGQVVRTALSPVQRLFGSIYYAIDSRLEVYRDHERVLAENEALRLEVQRLRTSLVKTHEIAAENARLRELQGYSAEAPYELAAARVVARDRQRWRDCIIIDKGTADGVEECCCVGPLRRRGPGDFSLASQFGGDVDQRSSERLVRQSPGKPCPRHGRGRLPP